MVTSRRDSGHSRAMPGPRVSFVVARADNGVIGRDNALPWHIPEDLKHFRRLTLGKPVVMGRRTWESLGKPLPGRHNIVVTRNAGFEAEGATVVPSLPAALAAAADAEEVMVIGGAALFAEALPLATRVHLTEVHASPDGDVTMPGLGEGWREADRDDRDGHSFVTLERAR